MADSPGAFGPWLKNGAWAAREIRDRGGISTFYLVIAYLLFLSTLWAMLASDKPMEGGAIVMAGAIVFVFTPGLTFIWLRHRKYGDNICRLITLPGVIGGWLKADVECRLPPGREPVTIRLINTTMTTGARYPSEKWRMEQTLASNPIPVGNTGRSIVRVRLRIPRVAGQVPMPFKTSLLTGVMWGLEVSKKAPGLSFVARFGVPVYDIPNAPEGEQLPEGPDGVAIE